MAIRPYATTEIEVECLAYIGLETPYCGPARYGLGSGAGQESDRARLESVYGRPGSGPDPNEPHGRDPGGRYVLLGTLLGLVLGITLGLLAGIFLDFSRYFGIVVGAIAGLLVGFAVGDRLKKRVGGSRGAKQSLDSDRDMLVKQIERKDK